MTTHTTGMGSTVGARKRTPVGSSHTDIVALVEEAHRETLRADLDATIAETRLLVRVRSDRRASDSPSLAALESLTLHAIDALAEVC